jgi:ABC-type sugar transport system ATPase subunit
MNKLKIKDLKVSYGENLILENFNIDINADELLVILGPSGCGKSTLLNAIAGLIKPDFGDIIFDSDIIYSKKDYVDIPVEKRNIGFVFQNYALWPHMNVFDNICYPLKVKKVKKNNMKHIVYNILESVNLIGKENCYPSELSGGEKQRVAIARAIASKSSILFLDEPLANIDSALKNKLLNLILKIKKQYNIPMIYVTHDQNEAFEIADRIVIMDKGKIIQDDCPKRVYMYPKNTFVANFVGCNNVIKDNNGKCGMLAVRPEDIVICNKGKKKGIIKKIKFKGCNNELCVQSESENIIINTSNCNKFKEGDTIEFDIKRSHVLDK